MEYIGIDVHEGENQICIVAERGQVAHRAGAHQLRAVCGAALASAAGFDRGHATRRPNGPLLPARMRMFLR